VDPAPDVPPPIGRRVLIDKFRPDRWDIAGARICLLGVVVIRYGPRSA